MMWSWLEVVTLVSFAIVQPILWIAGGAPVFLVAHDLSGVGVVWFALAIIAVPSAFFIALDSLVGLMPERARRVVRASLRGILVALTLVPPSIHAFDTSPTVSVILLLGVTAAATWVWLRFRVFATLVRTLSFAPVVFLIWFVGFSGARALVFEGDEPTASSGADRDVSVVWVVFDQLPLSLLVDGNGDIRSRWYPNFTRLADVSTWFSAATTVADGTAAAVPAALTGSVPEPGALPVASVAPVNLFTLLGGSHRVNAWETVTQLCPDTLCKSRQSQPRPSIVGDTWVLTVRRLFGNRLSDHLVSRIDEGWAGFGDRPVLDVTVENEATSLSEIEARRAKGDDRGRIEEFIASIESSTELSIHYLHIEKPHEPLIFVPDGRLYRSCRCFYPSDDERWPETGMTLHRIQAYVLQTMYVDTVLGRILDAIERSKDGENTVLVVMSDHGASLVPGTQNRVLTRATANDILPVPMFIRLPGQPEGVRDDRAVQITSILPTVLDYMGVDWESLGTDGVSLLDPEAIPVPRVLGGNLSSEPEYHADALQSSLISLLDRIFPDENDPYVFGPNVSLLGTSVTDHPVVDSLLVAKLRTSHFMAANVGELEVPGQVFGQIFGIDHEARIAVAVDDVILGSGWTFQLEDWNFAVMINPSVFNGEGMGEVRLFEVTPTRLEEIRIEEG